jgi:ferredoxin-thioredoxin reductase catalytic subunit
MPKYTVEQVICTISCLSDIDELLQLLKMYCSLYLETGVTEFAKIADNLLHEIAERELEELEATSK